MHNRRTTPRIRRQRPACCRSTQTSPPICMYGRRPFAALDRRIARKKRGIDPQDAAHVTLSQGPSLTRRKLPAGNGAELPQRGCRSTRDPYSVASMSQPLVDALDEVNRILPHAKQAPVVAPNVSGTQGTGSSDNNKVSVTVTDSRISDCRVKEDALGLDAEDLAVHIRQAVNRALDDHDQQLVAVMQSQQDTDLSQLQERLGEISRQAERGMDEYLAGMRALLNETNRRIRS